MANVKTAVSIEKPLFEQAEDLARQMNVSRSRLYEMALEDFLRRQESERIFRQLNDVASEEDAETDAEEARLREGMRSGHRRQVEGEW